MKSVQRVWRGSDSAYQSHDAGEGGESATFGEPEGASRGPEGNLLLLLLKRWK